MVIDKNIIISVFFVRKKGYINLVRKSVHCPSVPVCVCYVHTAVMFLVNGSSPKPLDVATANFACA